MATKSENLEAAVAGLEQALAENAVGREGAWAGKVDQALKETESAAQAHLATLDSPEGRLVDVDRPQLPSPTVDRRTAELRRELEQFLASMETLRRQTQAAARTFGMNASPQNLAGALPVAPEAGAIPDFGVFRQHAGELVRSVQQFEEEEARLILDSVTPDIGAGD